MKRILIVMCTDPMMWYANYVGHEFALLSEDIDIFWSREPTGFKNIVRKKDAIVTA